jgi:surface antigen Omp85-like protein
MRSLTTTRSVRARAAFAMLAPALLVLLAASPGFAQEAPAATPAVPGLLSEPHLVSVGMEYAGKYLGGTGEAKDGIYPTFGGMFTGAGWLSVGGGYRKHVLNDRLLFDGSVGISWRGYKLAQARFELPRLAGSHVIAGSQVIWQDLTQVNHFGIGPGSLESNRSEYRIKSTDVIGYTTYRPVRWLSFGGRIGWLNRPTLSSPAGPFDRGYQDARVTFFEDPAIALERQPGFLHGDLSVTADTRDYPSHPTSGAFYRAAWTMYSDGTFDRYAFRRYEVEGLQVVPAVPGRWTFLVHSWATISDAGADQLIPVYMLPSLGGGNTLRAFPDFRFHDRNALVASVESRVALFTHVDVAVFVDAGSVGPRFEDLNLENRSYGGGIRFHTRSSTIARIDLSRGREGWKAFFSLNDPFRIKRVARTTTGVPFVP